MKTKAQSKAEARAAILTVMDATGAPMKAADIAAHPAGRKYGSRTIGQLLKNMDQVEMDRKTQKWRRVQAKQIVAVARPRAASDTPVVVYSRSQHRLILKVDGAEFPFDIID